MIVSRSSGPYGRAACADVPHGRPACDLEGVSMIPLPSRALCLLLDLRDVLLAEGLTIDLLTWGPWWEEDYYAD